MDARTHSRASRQVEALLDSPEKNLLTDFLRQESVRRVEATGAAPSNYQVFVVRRNDDLGDEIFGPKRLDVGTYSEDTLYGATGSPLVRFRFAIRSLQSAAQHVGTLQPENLEYGHQVALFWADVGRLREFIGTTPLISEIVSELRTARFQFIGKDTPPSAMAAVSAALNLLVAANRIDASLVDRFVDLLEAGGIDSLAPDALRDTHA